MRHRYAATIAIVALAATQVSCKDEKADAARRSEREVISHVRQAREGLDRLTRGFVPLLESLAPEFAAPVAANREDDVRFALIGANTRQTSAGSLTGFPAGFLIATNREGMVIAKNAPQADDRMRGTNVARMFPAVREALEGRGNYAVGEQPNGDGPPALFLVAAVPIRGADGSVVGALASGIAFGRVAKALLQVVRLNAGASPVLSLGLMRGQRVLPSGNDSDVEALYLVPQSLISKIPPDAGERLQRTTGFTWNFVDERGWAGGVGRLFGLEGTSVVVFRSEAQQR